jgi:ABC-type nitrate/sulfonate/bicarbonate transport system permease component
MVLSTDERALYGAAGGMSSASQSSASQLDVMPPRSAAPNAPSPRARRTRRRVRNLSLQLTSVAVALAIWQYVGTHTNPILFATPLQVYHAFIDLIRTGQLQSVMPAALEDLAMGYGLAIVVGIFFGVLFGRSATIETVANPYINLIMATPLIGAVPLMVIWFGIGQPARVFTVFLLAFPSVIVNTMAGVKSTPRVLREVSQIYRLSRMRIVREVMLLNAVPNIFAGLRIALGKALIGMIIGEMEISISGLGGLIFNYGNEFKTAYLITGLLLSAMIGVTIAALLSLLQAKAFPWVAATTVGAARPD